MAVSINENEWKDEQVRVDRITGLLKSHIRALSEELGLHRSDVVELRKDFWEEVTVNFSSPDDLGETSTSLRQQAQVLSERERHHLQSSKALKNIKSLWCPLTSDALISQKRRMVNPSGSISASAR